jgi:hypothetical protein
MGDDAARLGWWTISGADLLDMLRRAHAGEDPGVVYAEAYVNSDVTDYSGRGDRG